MPSDTDLLFGEIAIELGFCTREQVDHCLRQQEAAGSSTPLGRQLVDEGWLSEDRHTKVLGVQRKRMLRKKPVAGEGRESHLFGQLVVMRGFLTVDQVNACLREQGRPDEVRSLGEIMVSKGLLTPAQVKETLAQQSKTIMSCAACRVSFTVFSMTRRSEVNCPRCKNPLALGKPSESTHTDGDLVTSTTLRAQRGARGAGTGETPWPARTRVKVACRICSESFEALVDSTGRVTCPTCETRFVVKRPGS